MLNKSICIFILLFGICHANIPSWIKAPATTEKSKPADAPKNSEKSENSKPTKPPKKKKQKTKNSVLQVEHSIPRKKIFNSIEYETTVIQMRNSELFSQSLN